MTNKELKEFAYTLAFFGGQVNYDLGRGSDSSLDDAKVEAIQFLLATDCKGVTVQPIVSALSTAKYSGFVVSRCGFRFWVPCLSYNYSSDAMLRQECIDYLVYMGWEAIHIADV